MLVEDLSEEAFYVLELAGSRDRSQSEYASGLALRLDTGATGGFGTLPRTNSLAEDKV